MPCLILSYVPAHCIVLLLVPPYFVLVYEYIIPANTIILHIVPATHMYLTDHTG